MESESHSPSDLIVKLARIMHTSGAAADELEQRMEQAANTLGVTAHFFSTPTSLFITFDNESHSTRLIRVTPAETNLAKLARLYELYRRIETGQLDVPAAFRELTEIETARYDYGEILNVVSFGVIGAGAAIFLGGNLTVVVAAGIIGLIVGVLVRGCERALLPNHLSNVLAGFVATVLANVSQFYLPDSSVELVLLASLIVLLPGLQITVSVNELATQNLASGTARMAGALTTFLTMIFGVVMGYGFSEWIVVLPAAVKPIPLGTAWALIALVPVSLSFCVLFRARQSDIPWMLLATGIAFGTALLAGMYLGPIAAAWSASLVVGICSNLFARMRNAPAAIMLMPGLLLLVPGSMGFFGLSAIAIHNDVPAGLQIVFTMILVAVSLVAGLLVSNVICPIEKPARH